MTTLETRIGTYPVIRQDWEESERGWGVRPDGYSLHKDEASLRSYIQEYWDGMPDEVPDEYSRPSGSPYIVSVDSATYKQVCAGSMRRFS